MALRIQPAAPTAEAGEQPDRIEGARLEVEACLPQHFRDTVVLRSFRYEDVRGQVAVCFASVVEGVADDQEPQRTIPKGVFFGTGGLIFQDASELINIRRDPCCRGVVADPDWPFLEWPGRDTKRLQTVCDVGPILLLERITPPGQ